MKRVILVYFRIGVFEVNRKIKLVTMLAQQAQKDAVENSENMAAVKHEAEVRTSVSNSADKIINATRWIKWK